MCRWCWTAASGKARLDVLVAEGAERPEPSRLRLDHMGPHCPFGDLSPLPILAELDTQLIIAEMQGYAPYAHEMKSRIIGLMAAIRKFAAALRK